MKKYRWLIFDADHTLFDFDHAQERAFYALLSDQGIDPNDELYHIYQDINHAAWRALEQGTLSPAEIKYVRFERFFKKIGHPADARLAGQRYLQYLSMCNDLLPGADQLIRSLAQDYRMLLITNGLKEVQRTRFENSPLFPFFEDLIISEEVGVAKPDPEIFEIAFRNRNVDKTKILMIGDNLSSDIAGGLNWGIATCWYNPLQKKNTSGLIPHYEINSFRALQIILGVARPNEAF